MRPLSVVELLSIWEAGTNQSLIEKSLQLLSIACSTNNLEEIACLSIGERDARLLQLREWIFGSRLINLSDCPECSSSLEWTMDIKDIKLQDPQSTEASKIFTLQVDEFAIRFRLPNSFDLSRLISSNLYQTNPKKMLCEFVLEVQRNQNDCRAEELPDHVLEILNQRMNKEDPQANISILLTCPDCSHQWEALFDIMSYLWIEINSWARHMLQEVYVLATAFGWSEHDILSMSSHRRQLYLEMIRS